MHRETVRREKTSGWARVYGLVKSIPRGRVITYGQLARRLRLPGGARTAGRAMAACPNGSGVPWHRVIGSNGRILLGEPLAALQRRLLESEGLIFEGGRIDLRSYQWVPGPKRSSRECQPHRQLRPG
jgi:methylated-DNA-protein-cysteine methyltransferase related protein